MHRREQVREHFGDSEYGVDSADEALSTRASY